MPSEPMTAAEMMRAARLAVLDRSDGREVSHDECMVIMGHAFTAIYRALPWYGRLWWRIRGWFR